jgi:hypothetical protein
LSSKSEDLRTAKEKARKNRKRGKAKEQRKWKKATHSVKFKPPFVWNGKPDIDVFDHWTFEVDSWIDLTRLPDKLALKLLVNFMSGSASKFFMQHVVTCLKQWTVKDVYIALFDYCFPADFKEQLRMSALRPADSPRFRTAGPIACKESSGYQSKACGSDFLGWR